MLLRAVKNFGAESEAKSLVETLLRLIRVRCSVPLYMRTVPNDAVVCYPVCLELGSEYPLYKTLKLSHRTYNISLGNSRLGLSIYVPPKLLPRFDDGAN